MNQEAITIIVAIIGSGGFGALAPWVLDRIDNRRDPLHEGVKELLFCKLELLHRQMVDNGGVCTVETKRTAERIYRAYSGLGGNGVGTEMRNDILDAHIQEDRKLTHLMIAGGTYLLLLALLLVFNHVAHRH